MSPASPDNHPGFELPQPHIEDRVIAVPPAEAVPLVSEQQSRVAELPGTTAPPPTSPQPTAHPTAQVVATDDPIPAVSASALPTAAPNIADDADLIEKEWVDKAKEIVERTRDDPHQQNKQLNAFKADYMKKRYSKEISLSED